MEARPESAVTRVVGGSPSSTTRAVHAGDSTLNNVQRAARPLFS